MTDSQSIGVRVVEGVLAVITLIVVVVFLAVVEFDPGSTAHLIGLLLPAGLLGVVVLAGAILDGYSPATLGVGLVAGLSLAVTIWTGLGVFSPEQGVFFDGLLVEVFGAVLAIIVLVRTAHAIAVVRAESDRGGDPLGDY